jgi:hypothetical protein
MMRGCTNIIRHEDIPPQLLDLAEKIVLRHVALLACRWRVRSRVAAGDVTAQNMLFDELGHRHQLLLPVLSKVVIPNFHWHGAGTSSGLYVRQVPPPSCRRPIVGE